MGGSNAPSAPNAPAYVGSQMSINGQNLASQSIGPNGQVVSNYNMNPVQQQEYNNNINNMATMLPSLNTLDPQTQQNLQKQAQATYNNGEQQLNSAYQPQYQTDVASVANRFGGLNNSGVAQTTAGLNEAQDIGQANLANQYTGNLQNLYNNQLQQQYNYYNQLNNANQTMLGNAYNALNYNTGNTNAANQFVNQQYGTQAQMYGTQAQMYDQQQADNARMLASIGGGVATGAGVGLAATFSDERLKENVVKVGAVKGVNLYTFTYKQDNDLKLPTSKQVGMIAQEVLELYPQFVSVDKSGYYMIDYTKLINHLLQEGK